MKKKKKHKSLSFYLRCNTFSMLSRTVFCISLRFFCCYCLFFILRFIGESYLFVLIFYVVEKRNIMFVHTVVDSRYMILFFKQIFVRRKPFLFKFSNKAKNLLHCMKFLSCVIFVFSYYFYRES